MLNSLPNNFVFLDFILTLLENGMVILFVELFLKKRNNYTIFFILILTLVSYVIHHFINQPVYASILLIILLLLYCHVNLEGTFYQKISTIAFVYISLIVIDLSVVAVAALLHIDIASCIATPSINYFIIVLFQKSIFLIEFMAIKKYLQQKEIISTPTTYFMALLILCFVLLPEIIITKYVGQSTIDILTLVICIIDFAVIVLLMMNIYKHLSQDYQKYLEQEMLLESTKYEKKLLESLEERIIEMNQLNHDFNKHKDVINSLIESNQNIKVINYLKECDQQNNFFVYTDNDILTFILNKKIEEAKSYDIDIKCIIQGKFKQTINDVDLSIILSNLLDNAIEAANQADDKFIVVNIKHDNNKLVLDIQNSYKEIKFIDNAYLSTKNKKKKHGYGLSNIKQICDKYNGMEYIHHENYIFQHICILILK